MTPKCNLLYIDTNPGHLYLMEPMMGAATGRGWDIERKYRSHLPRKAADMTVDGHDAVWIWNGLAGFQLDCKLACQRLGIPYLICERTPFRAVDWRGLYISHAGLARDGAIMPEEPNNKGWERYKELQRRHREVVGVPQKDEDVTLVPLQMNGDNQMHRSPWETMTDYVLFLEGQGIEFECTRHPSATKPDEGWPEPIERHLVHTPTAERLLHVKRVRGITSSVLVEAAMLGLEVYSDGRDVSTRALLTLSHNWVDSIESASRILEPWFDKIEKA